MIFKKHTPAESTNSRHIVLIWLVVVCFLLSGFAALLYQTAWMRLFSIAFGTSEIATAVVLAGYMAGLALGAAIAAHYLHRIRRPILVYGILEGGIAVAALSMPLFLEWSAQLYTIFAGGQPTPPDASGWVQPVFYVIASCLILLLPTVLMGATLPLLARYLVKSDTHLGSRISLLYAFNTLGAVIGTLVAGFILLPSSGLHGTVWFGVLINALVFVLAIILSRQESTDSQYNDTETQRTPSKIDPSSSLLRRRNFILPLILCSGAVSFIYEVLWTRMLSHILGSSVYAFSTMLAAFLTGITLGAAGAGWLAKKSKPSVWYFCLAQAGIALGSIFAYLMLESWSHREPNPVLYAFVVILPSAIFIGATYPLAVRIFAANAEDAGTASAKIYSWNTVGAIVGALLGGYFIIPLLGFASTVKLAVTLNLLLGWLALAAWHNWKTADHPTKWNIRKTGLWKFAAYACLIVFLFNPARPNAIISSSTFGGNNTKVIEEVHFSVGRSSTVYMIDNGYQFALTTNGLPEAQADFAGTEPSINSQRWLGLWPSLVRPKTNSMLVVGLGAAIALEGVSNAVRDVDVIELEPEVVKANQAIGSRRIIDPMSDSRFNIVTNDARNALRLTHKSYDAIVSQPSHPWTAGASHLFTQEFFALVKNHLHENGVFIQWMNAELLDEVLLGRLIATLRSEFEFVRAYQVNNLSLQFIASNSPINPEALMTPDSWLFSNDPTHLSNNGVFGQMDIASHLTLDEIASNTLAKNHSPIVDNDNRMAFDTFDDGTGLTATQLADFLEPVDPFLTQEGRNKFNITSDTLPYVVQILYRTNQLRRLVLLSDSFKQTNNGTEANFINGFLLHKQSKLQDASRLLSSIPSTHALYSPANYILLADSLTAISNGETNWRQSVDSGFATESLKAVLIGVERAGNNNYAGVQSLDHILASTSKTAIWRPQALRLMAEWRLHIDDSSTTHLRDALALINEALVLERKIDLHWLRAKIALRLGLNKAHTASVSAFIVGVRKRIRFFETQAAEITDSERQNITLFLDQIFDQLNGYQEKDKTGRSHVVLEQLNIAQDKLSTLP